MTLKFGSSTAYQLPLWLVGSPGSSLPKINIVQQKPSIFNDELLVSSTVLHMVVMESLEGFSEFPFNYGWLVSTIFWTFTLAKSGGSCLVGWL